MDHLDQLQDTSIHILREAYANFKNLGMLWSIGKDSTVLLWLARKAFFGHVPFTLIHIDTSYKIPEMIQYRDRLVEKLGLNLLYGINEEALRKSKPSQMAKQIISPAVRSLRRTLWSIRSTVLGSDIALTIRQRNMNPKRTASRSMELSPVREPTKRVLVRKSDTFHRAIKIVNGILPISRLNSGIFIKPISPPARTSASIRCSTGQS
jgi:hypothetical protein